MENYQLAQRIRAFRKLKGYTQNDLADELNISIAILGAIERGTRIPDEQTIEKICSVLDVSPEELYPAQLNG